ncbi:MAG: hypothetical protein ACOYWZ_04650 [Bacillota bacterium]
MSKQYSVEFKIDAVKRIEKTGESVDRWLMPHRNCGSAAPEYSTHETDKENYILYKFLKYNLKGQSFNVKDNMY